MTNLKLHNVRTVMEFGKLLHNIGLFVSGLVLFGVAFDITLLYKPFLNTATSVQTLCISIFLLILSRCNPYYGYSKLILWSATIVFCYLILGYLSNNSVLVDTYIHNNLFGDFNGREMHTMSGTTQLIMMSICIGIIMKPFGGEKLRSIILFTSSFLPFNVFMAYIMGNDYIVNGTGFWTMMILGFAAWGTLFRQVHRKHLRYFFADPEVQKISTILLGSIILVFQGILISFPYVVPGVKDLPQWWTVLPLVGEWVVIGAIVAAMARVSAISYHNRKLIREKHMMATVDMLTGAQNRNGFYDMFNKRKKGSKTAGLILCDIDHFKKVNDIHGHDKGDQILKQFADCLKVHVRNGDCVIRWGGEEFLIFCENINATELKELADRLRCEIEKLDVHPKITSSFGCDIINEYDGLSISIKRSDDRLYQAKKLGRNVVVDNDATVINLVKHRMVDYLNKYPKLFKESYIQPYMTRNVSTDALLQALNRMELVIRANTTVDKSKDTSKKAQEYLHGLNYKPQDNL